MKKITYYIIDDNIAIVKSLEKIIKLRELGNVCGCCTDPEEALEEILEERPDIVLVDLLMGGMDGITLMDRVKERIPEISFVMVSKVTDKEMVQQAYTAGVEFFIHKPVNLVEVETVLRNVADRIKMREVMGSLQDIFQERIALGKRAVVLKQRFRIKRTDLADRVIEKIPPQIRRIFHEREMFRRKNNRAEMTGQRREAAPFDAVDLNLFFSLGETEQNVVFPAPALERKTHRDPFLRQSERQIIAVFCAAERFFPRKQPDRFDQVGFAESVRAANDIDPFARTEFRHGEVAKMDGAQRLNSHLFKIFSPSNTITPTP